MRFNYHAVDSHSFLRYYKRDLTKIILVLKARLIPLMLSEEVIAQYNPNLKKKKIFQMLNRKLQVVSQLEKLPKARG